MKCKVCGTEMKVYETDDGNYIFACPKCKKEKIEENVREGLWQEMDNLTVTDLTINSFEGGE